MLRKKIRPWGARSKTSWVSGSRVGSEADGRLGLEVQNQLEGLVADIHRGDVQLEQRVHERRRFGIRSGESEVGVGPESLGEDVRAQSGAGQGQHGTARAPLDQDADSRIAARGRGAYHDGKGRLVRRVNQLGEIGKTRHHCWPRKP